MASSYAANNQDKIDGLILLGAYIYGDFPPVKALTIYGTLNANLEENINYTDNIVFIEGGNHAQFGNYGQQKGDPPATISSEEQQDIAVQAILDFIKERSEKSE
ncbi:alpha/beta hydrolase [Acetobacterium sp.]|uniref:alpha/beta hydrolase n=1 Tax=Acetobacterium sp. TaxID=1872094 RepID=UPI0035933C63